MENYLESIKLRFAILIIFFILAFVVIAAQLFSIQVVQGEQFYQDSQRRLVRSTNVKAPRGSIYDRNFNSIASNTTQYDVWVARTSARAEDLNDMIYELIKIFEKNGESYVDDLTKRLEIEPLDYGVYIKHSEDLIRSWHTNIVLRDSDLDGLETAEDVFNYFKEIFRISSEFEKKDAYNIMRIRYQMLVRGYTAVDPIVLATDVSKQTVANLEEMHFKFPGFFIQTAPRRTYVDAKPLGPIIGYLGSLSDEQYRQKQHEGYKMDDLIGQSGIELFAEDALRGIDGLSRFEADANWRFTSHVGGEPVVPGDDVVLTIDSELQKIAVESLGENIKRIREGKDDSGNYGDAQVGAAVAIDVNSGEVLALASYPSYDPDVFVASSDDRAAQAKNDEYLTDFRSPMFNRAIRGTYHPGSTYKPLVAIAALQEDTVTPNTVIHDSGTYDVPGKTFTCYRVRRGYTPHGDVSLTRAMGVSSNVYFWSIGVDTGIDNISKWANYFGLGQRTGIEIPGEAQGLKADRQNHQGGWLPAHTAHSAIGEVYSRFTPLQLANYTASIANGGKLFKPHVIKSVISADGSNIKDTKVSYEEIPVSKETLDSVKEGMEYAANRTEGTAYWAFADFPIKVAAKTGTAEREGEVSSNSLFIAYAPVDDPEIAVAVVIEQGVWGSNSAPIARDIFAKYFGIDEQRESERIAFPQNVRLTY